MKNDDLLQFGDYIVITGHNVDRKLIEEAKEKLVEQYFTWDFYKELWRYDCVAWIEQETRMHDANTGEEFDCTTIALKFTFLKSKGELKDEKEISERL